MKRTLVAVALIVVFVMALATPALAAGHPGIMHTAAYELDGTINFEKQAGHLCNTGAQIMQTISGNGVMDKVQTVSMTQGKITMDDANDWVAGATALTVTTVWELCAPPKYTYEDDDGYEAVVHPSSMYMPDLLGGASQPYSFFLGGFEGQSYKMADTYDDWDAVSEQIWAVQVMADAGFSGNLHQTGEAAYGAYWSQLSDDDANWREGLLPDGAANLNFDNRWRWELQGDNNVLGVGVGKNYVGNYFIMEQHARTSMGTLKRFIDISSPWNHGYLMEDMSVVGRSDVQESFAMTNLPKGADIVGLWWDLF